MVEYILVINRDIADIVFENSVLNRMSCRIIEFSELLTLFLKSFSYQVITVV